MFPPGGLKKPGHIIVTGLFVFYAYHMENGLGTVFNDTDAVIPLSRRIQGGGQ